MKTVILAAGMGTRLGALGQERPKCLLPVGDSTLLGFLLSSLRASTTVEEVVVVGGYCRDQLRRHLPEDVALIENPEFETTNSLHSLWLALREAEPCDLAVFNADVLYQPNLVIRFLDHPSSTACLIDELRPYDPNEYQVRIEDGLIVELDRGLSPDRVMGQDAQAFKVSREDYPFFLTAVRKLLDAGSTEAYAGQGVIALMESGKLRPIFTNNQFWYEMDSEEEYRECLERVAASGSDLWIVDSYAGKSPPSTASSVDDGPPEAERPEAPTPGAGGASRPLWMVRRAAQCITRRELPWRLRWIPDFLQTFRKAPRTALPHLPSLLAGRLSPAGFHLQAYGQRMLEDLMEESDALGIRPFLLWGTLLGHVREGRFILDDHDVDLAMLEGDFMQADELRGRMERRGYRLRYQDPWKLSFLHPMIDTLWLDIDLVYESAGHMVSTNRSKEEFDYSYLFPRHPFRDLRREQLMGVDVYIPDDPEEVLWCIYGEWRTPRPKRNFLTGPLNARMERKGPESAAMQESVRH